MSHKMMQFDTANQNKNKWNQDDEKYYILR